MAEISSGPISILLYDGECGLCARSVRFVLEHEAPSRRGQVLFAPLGGAFGAALMDSHPELAGIDSLLWFRRDAHGHETILVRSDAVCAALRHIGSGWRMVAMTLSIVPRMLRDRGYDWVAARRRHWVAAACLLPSAEQKARFLL